MILIYPIGIPSIYGYILWRRRGKIKLAVEEREKDAELMATSFLFDAYKPEFWWFELFETCRRLLLTGVLGVISPGSMVQLVAGILISFGGTLMYIGCRPYTIPRNSFLAVLTNLQIFVVMLSSVLLKYKKALVVNSGSIAARTENNEGLGVFLIIFNVSGIAFLAIVLFVKFVLPKTAEEKKKMGSSIWEVFTGKRKKTGGGGEENNSVGRIEDGNIELGSVYINTSSSFREDEDSKSVVNPMNDEAFKSGIKIGAFPMPPRDWKGYETEEFKHLKKTEDEERQIQEEHLKIMEKSKRKC